MFIPSISELLFYFVVNTNNTNLSPTTKETVIASREISMENRYGDTFVNGIFRDNILLNLAYMEGKVKDAANINWGEITKPSTYRFVLRSGESFAFHADVKPQYQKKLVKTTNANFNSQQGFKSDGYLVGDGVCHLASLIYWVAKDANLDALAPTNHDFRAIPEIPREYGVSIYNYPGQTESNSQQNLYITNTMKNTIMFVFEYDGKILKLSAVTKDQKPTFSL